MKQLNFSFITNEISNDKNTIKEIIIILKKTVDDYRLNMNQALKNEDYDSIFYEAHKMVTPFSMLGLKELKLLASNIEKYAKEKVVIKQIRFYHQKIEVLLIQLDTEIEELINSSS